MRNTQMQNHQHLGDYSSLDLKSSISFLLSVLDREEEMTPRLFTLHQKREE